MPPEPLGQSQSGSAVILRQPQREFRTAAILQFNYPLRTSGAGSHRHLDKLRSKATGPRSLPSCSGHQMVLEGGVINPQSLSYRAQSIASRQPYHRAPEMLRDWFPMFTPLAPSCQGWLNPRNRGCKCGIGFGCRLRCHILARRLPPGAKCRHARLPKQHIPPAHWPRSEARFCQIWHCGAHLGQRSCDTRGSCE